MKKAFNSIQAVSIIVIVGVLIAVFVPRAENLFRDSEALAIKNSINTIAQNAYGNYMIKNELNITKALADNEIKTFEITSITLNALQMNKAKHTDIFIKTKVIDEKFHILVKIYSLESDFLKLLSKTLERKIDIDENNISSITYKKEFEIRTTKKW